MFFSTMPHSSSKPIVGGSEEIDSTALEESLLETTFFKAGGGWIGGLHAGMVATADMSSR